jgi:hypothetical protein
MINLVMVVLILVGLLVVGHAGYMVGAVRVGLVLMEFLPVDHEHRGWGLRLRRTNTHATIQVGWIGRANVWRTRSR